MNALAPLWEQASNLLKRRQVGNLPPRRLAIDVALACLLFWGTHAVYRGSTGHVQNCDSVYSLVVTEQLLTHGNVDLSERVAPDQILPYQLAMRVNRNHSENQYRVYYGYPLGSSILSIPFVQSNSRRGLSMFHPDGRANTAVEDLLQMRIAATLSAAIVVLFYVLCRFFCSPLVSVLIAAGFAFGSPVWSTLSRSLWSHTWMVALLSGALVLLLARRRVERATWRTDLAFGIALGTVLFWMLFTRAHGIFSAAAIGFYLLIHHRRMLLATLGTGSIWSIGFVTVSLHLFGTLTPPSVYSSDTIDGRDLLNRFAWLMVSPSRGLLVYCPYLAAVAGILIAFRKHLTDASLLLPAGVAIAAHTLLFSCYDGWHMGSSFGPRYFCDLLPWFVLANAIAVRGALNEPGLPWRKGIAIALLALCFGWGGFVHSRGANSMRAWLWNWRAIAVGHEAAVKDWRHPQFLAGITFEVKPDGSIVEK